MQYLVAAAAGTGAIGMEWCEVAKQAKAEALGPLVAVQNCKEAMYVQEVSHWLGQAATDTISPGTSLWATSWQGILKGTMGIVRFHLQVFIVSAIGAASHSNLLALHLSAECCAISHPLLLVVWML